MTLARLANVPMVDRGPTFTHVKLTTRDCLAAFITARDPVCGYPGCNQPAVRCDLDHATGFDDGGRTTRCNLGPLCRQHHNAKTHKRWTLTYQPSTGARTWTSPLGKTYLKTGIPRLL